MIHLPLSLFISFRTLDVIIDRIPYVPAGSTLPAAPVAGSLKNAATDTATFVAPQTAGVFTFQLKVSITNAGGVLTSRCATKTTAITVQKRSATNTDTVTVESFTWTNSQSGTISVTCRSNVVDGSVTRMTLSATTLTGGQQPMVSSTGDPGLFTFQARSVKNPGSVSCASNLGGNSGTQIATAKRSLSNRATA